MLVLFSFSYKFGYKVHKRGWCLSMKENKITNLKEFMMAYGSKKSDIEISQMLSVPIEQVKSERGKMSLNYMKRKIRSY